MKIDVEVEEYFELINAKVMYYAIAKAIYAAFSPDPQLEQVGNEMLYRIYEYVIKPEIEKAK